MAEKSFFEKITYTDGIYPVSTIKLIQNPNKFYAVPILGFLVKHIILIPVIIEVIILSIWLFIAAMIINPFVVLFTGKYWNNAYSIALGMIRISAKMQYFLFGLTDKYPGFSLKIDESYSVDIPLITNPSKLFAFPLLGLLMRMILIIPYYMFLSVISQAACIGTYILAWAVVLFKGRYPESLFELSRDAIRVSLSNHAYMLGLSDKYPSFYISMAHDKIKIILIVIAIILGGMSFGDSWSDKQAEPSFENIINNSDYL